MLISASISPPSSPSPTFGRRNFASMAAGAATIRSLSTLSRNLSISLKPHHLLISLKPQLNNPRPDHFFALRSFSSVPNQNPNTNSTVSFDWSDDENELQNPKEPKTQIDKSKLPPPYDPFNKKPINLEPRDPSNLQEIFHKMRTDGLTNHAVKMFDALSKSGLTHEAMELFAVIKDKGTMPDVVAHTAVVEAYANAGGHTKEAVRTFERMLANGVLPNLYTYSVLIKGLAKDGKLMDAKKYLLEMMGRGMRPSTETYVKVFEGYIKEKKVEDARSLVEEMKGRGFVFDEKAVREEIGKRGGVFRNIMTLLFNK